MPLPLPATELPVAPISSCRPDTGALVREARPILTARLRLAALPEPFLQASLRRDRAAAEALLGGAVPPEWWAERDLIALGLEDLRADPAYRPWSVRAICLRAGGAMVGHVGFHTRPGADDLRPWTPDAAVALGYTVFPTYRRRGYAREASLGLLRWAASAHGVPWFVLTIAPGNEPSHAVARSLGFARVGERVDPVDGPEDVYRLPAAAVLAAPPP